MKDNKKIETAELLILKIKETKIQKYLDIAEVKEMIHNGDGDANCGWCTRKFLRDE